MNWQAESKRESQKKIIEAIAKGGKTWNELVEATGLSKHTLYSHFPEMEREGLIKRELKAEPGRKAKILYVLTLQGRQRIYALHEKKYMEIISSGLAEFIQATYRKLPRFVKDLKSWFLGEEYKSCVSFTLSHEKKISNENELEDHVRTALSYLLSQHVNKPKRIGEITENDFNLTFRFDKNALEKILWEKKEAEKHREPLFTRPPPNPDDYLDEDKRRNVSTK